MGLTSHSAVSYTHLDVYKRQAFHFAQKTHDILLIQRQECIKSYDGDYQGAKK